LSHAATRRSGPQQNRSAAAAMPQRAWPSPRARPRPRPRIAWPQRARTSPRFTRWSLKTARDWPLHVRVGCSHSLRSTFVQRRRTTHAHLRASTLSHPIPGYRALVSTVFYTAASTGLRFSINVSMLSLSL